MERFILKIIAWIIRGKVVELTSFSNNYLSIAKVSSETLQCHVHWFTRIGNCILLDNGEISQESESIYIIKWKYV